ncbi:MAG: alpha/beta hydrolase [Lautropia sp.]|nr:alpha/beta hydrolase [Lautropia sp.]
MPLNPDIEDFLALVNGQKAGRTRLHQMPPAEARAAYDRTTGILDLPGVDVLTRDVRIPTRDGINIRGRLYDGVGDGQVLAPVLLFFHGGGYVLGGLESHDGLCRALSSGARCRVLSVDYRLAPEYRFPTAFHDAEDALKWLYEQGEAHGLDANRLVIGGDSVGGSLAAALCLAQKARKATQPSLQLLIYPCTAAWQDTESHRRLAEGYLLEGDDLQWMFAQYLNHEAERHDWRFAPAEAPDFQGLAPAHIVLAEYDPLSDEGRAYGKKLEQADVRVSLREYAGMVHDFARMTTITEEALKLRGDLAVLLNHAFYVE